MDDEYTWIKGYLEGEVDWERLVLELGEDMARGVRITEQYFWENGKKGVAVEQVVNDIDSGGRINTAIRRVIDQELDLRAIK